MTNKGINLKKYPNFLSVPKRRKGQKGYIVWNEQREFNWIARAIQFYFRAEKRSVISSTVALSVRPDDRRPRHPPRPIPRLSVT